MRLERDASKELLTLALLAISLFGSGCASMVESMFMLPLHSEVEAQDYKSRVAEYKSRGVSQKNAERAAYEAQFFDSMKSDP